MDALEALAQFKSTGTTKTVKKFKPTPSLKFSKKGGEYVIGTKVRYKELKNSKAGKGVLEIELQDTNAQFTISGDEDGVYTPVPVKAGDKVSVFAPTDLAKYLENVADGTVLYIHSQGKVKENRDGKSIEAYKFDVRAK